MYRCPNCQYDNRTGEIFCERCGASLLGTSPLGTHHINGDVPITLPDSGSTLGSALFPLGSRLRLEVKGAPPKIVRMPRELVFGRRDPETGAAPHIDLTAYDGYRLGVSRRHAVLRHDGGSRLELCDLGSANGTYLNGVRLQPQQAQIVHDGDEIQIGQMIIHIYFVLNPNPEDQVEGGPVV